VNWRPWILAATFLAMLIANGALLFNEELRLPDQGDGPVERRGDELIPQVTYVATNRLDNFRRFGMSDEMAEDAFNLTMRAVDTRDQRRVFQMLLDQDKLVAGDKLCSNRAIPERYAALALLVAEVDVGGGVKEKRLVDWRNMRKLEVQDWYPTSRVAAVYEKLETGVIDRGDSTVMGVGAVLTGREQDVLDGNAPFGTGIGGWSQSRLLRL
jgi:hypothetical protein